MRMHGEGECGGAAVVAEDAQHRCKLIDGGAAAAELCRNAGFDQPGLFQRRKILSDEFVFVGRFMSALLEDRPQLARDIRQTTLLGDLSLEGG